MIIEPKIRGFICMTAHPKGCRKNVENQAELIRRAFPERPQSGPKKVLVLGCSTGYGLASRMTAAFAYKAATIGVMFEKEESSRRTATAGFYQTRAFEELATEQGLYARTVNGDAFSAEVKQQVIDLIRSDLGQVDLVVYSLAAPRRKINDELTYSSTLKTVGEPFCNLTWEMRDDSLREVEIPAATEEEIEHTVKVMGGEDWEDWIAALEQAGVLAEGAMTVAYSYIGPKLTYPIYRDGTIGAAKKHLHATAERLNQTYGERLRAVVSVNKAVVTQASSAIPVVPLYLALLYKVMKNKGLHEGCTEQIIRLFAERLYGVQGLQIEQDGLIHLDDWEMRDDVQAEVSRVWQTMTPENWKTFADLEGYQKEFKQLFGFEIEQVDYQEDIPLGEQA
ncbi:MAG: trans-2-enoyl-CoA reductase family protein [Eubacteriales bacterium]|nr:trans-2-enoyl-CoA reductase family protein [Eubacteriales bacterium]